MSAPRPTEAELLEVAEDVKRFTDPQLRKLILDLFERGSIAVGDRREDGTLKYVAAQLTERD